MDPAARILLIVSCVALFNPDIFYQQTRSLRDSSFQVLQENKTKNPFKKMSGFFIREYF